MTDFQDTMASQWAPSPSPLDRTIDLGVIDWDAIVTRYNNIMFITKLDGVAPLIVDPSTAEAPPIGKIHPFSKMSITFKPLMRF